MQACERVSRGVEKRTEWGQTVVHDDVLAVVAARAVKTVPGVVRTGHRGLQDNLGNLVGHDGEARGVRIGALPEGHYTVEIHVTAKYGWRLAPVGREIGDAVNRALFEAVGWYPDQIAIHFDGVVVLD